MALGDIAAMLEKPLSQSSHEQNGHQSEYKLLIENSADGIIVVDLAGITRFVNPAAEQIFGRSEGELLGTPIGIPLMTADVADVTLLRPGGAKIEAEMRVAAIEWRGESALLVGLRDITTRRLVEARLRQSQKLEAIGQLTAGAAHDFNNILMAVMGNLQLIGSRVSDDSLRRFVKNGIEAAQRGARLTTQLLAFSRKQELHVQPVDLNRLIDGAADLFDQATLDARARIQTVLDADLWPAMADPTQIELILLNLVINARDALPSGGVIKIETSNILLQDPRRPPDFLAPEGVALIVSDSGVGMSEEVRARAFDPFFTTKDVGKGSGLGLSMVYGVAKQLGGTVRLESELGKGTRVSVYLPRSTERPEAPQAETEEATPSLSMRERILLIDDDPQVLDTTAEMLRALGYEVIPMNDGRAALGFVQGGGSVDLVITDLSMPGLRGEQIIAEARRLFPDLPILAVTGRLDIGLDGTIPLLRKPFSASELSARVRECLAHAP